jgi:oligosaccharide repeat unit polymerase
MLESGEIVAVVLLSVLVGKFRGERFEIFSPPMIVNMFFVLYYPIRASFLMANTNFVDPHTFVYLNPASNVDYAWAMFYAAIGLVSFHSGYYIWSRQRAVKIVGRQNWSSTRVTRVAICGGAWAFLSAAVTVYAAGGIDGILNNVGRLREVTAGYAYGTIGAAYFSIVAVLLFVDQLLGRRRTGLLVLFGVMSVVYPALMGNRTSMFAVVVSCLASYVFIRGVRSPWKLILAATAIGVVVVPYVVVWGVFRQKNKSVEHISEIASGVLSQDSSVLYAQTIDEFSSLDAFAAVLHGGPSVFPFQYGRTYLDVLLFVVPRAVWPDKPKSFSTAIGDYVTSNGNDVPPGVIGELYINFHVLGVVAGMLLLGGVMREIYQRTRNGGYGELALYAFLVPYFAVFLSRNFLGGGILLLSAVFPMLPAIWYIEGPKHGAPAVRYVVRTGQGA